MNEGSGRKHFYDQSEFEADICSQCEAKNASQNQLLFLPSARCVWKSLKATEKNPQTKEFCQNGFSVFHISSTS